MFHRKNKRQKKSQEMLDIDLMEEIGYYQKKPQKKGLDQKIVIALVLVVVVAACVLFSPLFSVKKIEVNGASQFTTSALCEKIGLSKGDNLLLFSKGRAEKTLEKSPYIASAKLSAKLPHTMKITIKERKARGYVPYMGSYLYIDEEGRVLEVAGSCRDALPLVKGLKFDSFTEGEILPVQNTDALAVILEISQLMEKYELLDEVVEIDVSKPKDIYAYVNQVQIHLGNMTNGDMKIQYMQQSNNVMFNLLDSHDTQRLMSRFDDLDLFYQQLAVLFTMPGSACIYYGTEIAMEGGFDPDCRRCMPWQELDSSENQEKIQIMQKLIAMRKQEAACKSLYFHFPNEYEKRRLVEYIKLDQDGNQLEVLLNCSEESVSVKEEGEVLFSRRFEQGVLKKNGTLIRRKK